MKDRVISIRVSPEEYKHFSDLAKKDQRSLSDFMRIFITSSQKKTTKKKRSVNPAMKAAWFKYYGGEYKLEPKHNMALIRLESKCKEFAPDSLPEDSFTWLLNRMPQWEKKNYSLNQIDSNYDQIVRKITNSTPNFKSESFNFKFE